MVPLTLDTGQMTALVSYLSSLGGTSAASAATPPASGSSLPVPAKAEPDATVEGSKAASASAPLASGSTSPEPGKAAPDVTAGTSKAKAGSSAGDATVTRGKAIFDSNRCSGCHGQSGAGGVGPSLTHITTQYPPAQLTALLKAPRANMKAAGMVPLTLNAADMKALVSYLASLGGTATASAAAAPANGSSSPAPAKAKPDAKTEPSKDASATIPPTSGSSSTVRTQAEPVATAEPPKAKAGSSAGDATVAGGKSHF